MNILYSFIILLYLQGIPNLAHFWCGWGKYVECARKSPFCASVWRLTTLDIFEWAIYPSCLAVLRCSKWRLKINMVSIQFFNLVQIVWRHIEVRQLQASHSRGRQKFDLPWTSHLDKQTCVMNPWLLGWPRYWLGFHFGSLNSLSTSLTNVFEGDLSLNLCERQVFRGVFCGHYYAGLWCTWSHFQSHVRKNL